MSTKMLVFMLVLAMMSITVCAANGSFGTRFSTGEEKWIAEADTMTKQSGKTHAYLQVTSGGGSYAYTQYMIASSVTKTHLLENIIELVGTDTNPYFLAYTTDVGVSYNLETTVLMRTVLWDHPYSVSGVWNPNATVN